MNVILLIGVSLVFQLFLFLYLCFFTILYKEERKIVKLSKLWLLIPALIAGPINSISTVVFSPSAYAQEREEKVPNASPPIEKESSTQKFLRGFFGSPSKEKRVQPEEKQALPQAPLLSNISDQDIRLLLKAYQTALEEKNVEELVRLGVYSPQEADRVKEIFDRYKDYKVQLLVVEIHLDKSPPEVTVIRRDSLNGRDLPPFNETFFVKKEPGGRTIITKGA